MEGEKLPPKLVGADLLQAFLAHWHSEDNNAFKATITAAISDARLLPPSTGRMTPSASASLEGSTGSGGRPPRGRPLPTSMRW
jgi:hypothetical protein